MILSTTMIHHPSINKMRKNVEHWTQIYIVPTNNIVPDQVKFITITSYHIVKFLQFHGTWYILRRKLR